MNSTQRRKVVERITKKRAQVERIRDKQLPYALSESALCAVKEQYLLAQWFAEFAKKLEAESLRLRAEIDDDLRVLARDE